MKVRNEIWKDIPEYSNYQVSSLGNVRSKKYGNINSCVNKRRKTAGGYRWEAVCV